MQDFSFKEFKPTIAFLVKFTAFYLVGNILYGLYVTSFKPRPDPVTSFVSAQTAVVLTACGSSVASVDQLKKPMTWLIFEGRSVLSVYEGCNGLNTMIIFVAFILAFGPVSKKMLWYIPLGLLIIHLANLVRISLLFYVAEYWPHFMYFTHKYFFTAILYVVIFVMWIFWVKRFSLQPAHEK